MVIAHKLDLETTSKNATTIDSVFIVIECLSLKLHSSYKHEQKNGISK